MTERHDTEAFPPPAPYLIAPREEEIVNGAAVTFQWESVRDAAEYQLEIAADYAFEQVLLTQIVVGASSLTVHDTLPADKATYFWRVIARNAAGESHGDVVESFISGTAREATHPLPSPDQTEKLGPLSQLLVEGTKEMLHGEFQGPETDDGGVQHEGIGVGAIMGFVAIILAFIAVAVTAVTFWVQAYTQDLQSELALNANYPELREVDADATARLNRYDVLDAGQGTYQIPIDRAIDLMVNEAYQQPTDTPSPELPLRPGN